MRLRLALSVLVLAGGGVARAQGPKPPAEPAKVRIQVSPEAVSPGARADVTLRLEPIDGVKINRYPKIRLQVAEAPGLVQEAEAAIGNDAPPPPGKSDANYYKEVDPLHLELGLDPAAPTGSHKIGAKLTYFYCVAASGFCAPARVNVEIPVQVR